MRCCPSKPSCRYFLTNDITPSPAERPPFPLVSRLVGKARPGQAPDLMTWQVSRHRRSADRKLFASMPATEADQR